MVLKHFGWLIALMLGAGLAGLAGKAATFKLSSGGDVSGDYVSADRNAVVYKKADGTFERVAWTNLHQDTIKELAKQPASRKVAQEYLDIEEEQAPEKRKPPEIKFKEPPRLDRPDPKAGSSVLFKSSVGATLFALLYLANLYAAYEIALFRNYHPALVCGLAAVAPVLAPAVFLCLPTYIRKVVEEAPEVSEFAPTVELPVEAAAEAVEAAPAGPASPYPPPQIYQRGQFTFNRRFFETKLAGFLRVVPAEEEKNLVIDVSSARGAHTAQRIVRVQPAEVVFAVYKGGASAEVGIPYTEIKEVRVRHKDMPV